MLARHNFRMSCSLRDSWSKSVICPGKDVFVASLFLMDTVVIC